MYQRILSSLLVLLILMSGNLLFAQNDSSEAKESTDSLGWIDRNKNGEKDTYEDPEAAIEDRIADDHRRKDRSDGNDLWLQKSS